MTKKSELKKQANEILQMAKSTGTQGNYFFATTFERYLKQLEIIEKLGKEIKNCNTVVTKEYVKGRENVQIHPAVREYSKNVDSANKTVATLMKIIRTYGGEQGSDEMDPLMALINGDDESE